MKSPVKHLFTLAFASFALIATLMARAETRYVPLQYPTIQAAIDAAAPSETIVVAAGIYPESLSWLGKDLTIQGAGQGQSIIDPSAGGPGGRCLYTENLTAASRLEGFTLRRGSDGYGGGGMYNYASSPTVTDCTFSSNTASMYGGAMFNDYSSPALTRCIFSDNSAPHSGGGMFNNTSSPVVTDCTFSGNTSSADYSSGGGMYNNYLSNPAVTNCAFRDNSGYYGGGMGNDYNSDPTVTNCLFTGNSAVIVGGGIFNSYCSLTATNCTFAGNTAGVYGGGMDNHYSNSTITNCIFWGNTASLYAGIGYESSSPNVSHSDVQDLPNSDPDEWGNFSADPGFVDAANGDLRLRSASLCRDKGDSLVVAAPPFLMVDGVIVDLAGNPRFADSSVDLGAYEYRVMDMVAPTITWGAITPTPNAAGWNNTPVDIPFTVTDDDSGVATISTNNPLHFASEGANQTQTVIVTDNAGNSDTITSPAVNIDWTAPTTTASFTGTAATTVTLSRSDSLSGVKATYYVVDDGPQQTYTGPFTLSQGFHWVRYWSVDKADNQETANTLDIDTRYVVTVVVANVSGRRGGRVTLSATVTQTSNRAKLSGKVVTFTVDGVFAGNATTNKQGVASLFFTVPTIFAYGAHNIGAAAQPNGTHQSGYGTGTLTVNR